MNDRRGHPLATAVGLAADLLAPPRPAMACSCLPPPPPAEARAAADAVFVPAEAAALGPPIVDRPADDPPVLNCPRCPIPSAAGALAGANVAFLGQPLRVHDAGPEGDWSRRVRFRVLGAWKGDPPAEVDVTAPFLAWACRGQRWLDDPAGALVFAQRGAGGELTISICGRLERHDPVDAASRGPMMPVPSTHLFMPAVSRR